MIMNECIICGKECKGDCCSGACRAKKSRRTVVKAHATAHGRKRGREIKVFKDLPYDVQMSIESMSQYAKDQAVDKVARTARAIAYQHLYPGRYLNKSLVLDYVMTDFEREHYRPASKLALNEFNPVSKPGDSHYVTQLAPGQEIRT